MLCDSTKFQKEKVNSLLAEFGFEFKQPIETKDDFKNMVPVQDGRSFQDNMQKFYEDGKLSSTTFGFTSGSTGKPKLLANALWRQKSRKYYSIDLKEILTKYILSEEDVVANLTTPGGFSTLYDGCNRLLEGVNCTVLPIGRLDSHSKCHQVQMLNMMNMLNINALLGTPSSMIQLLRLAHDNDIELNIEKIIFTGEPLSNQKREFVNQYWPNAEFYGLYGHSETGFIGINTPNCEHNCYHVLDDFYYLETKEDSSLLVTSLADSVMPIIRYEVGDIVQISDEKCKCGNDMPTINLFGRSDQKFNFSGNLVDVNVIEDCIASVYEGVPDFQIQINCDTKGNDTLALVLNVKVVDPESKSKLIEIISSIDYIAEAIEKQAGVIDVVSADAFFTNLRQKTPTIVDFRGITE